MLCDHRRSFATLLGKEECERLYISPRPCRTIGTKGLFPIRSSQGRYFIRLQIWRGYWKRVIAHRQEKTLLSYRNCIHHVFYEKYVTDVFSCFCRLPCMKRRKLYENLQINTNLPRNREKNSIDGTYGHIHVKTNSHEYAQRTISVQFYGSLIAKFSTFIEISGQISCNLKKKDYICKNNH